MISRAQLDQTFKGRSYEGKVLSVYLDLHPESFGGQHRKREAAFNSLFHSLKAAAGNDGKALENNFQAVQRYLQGLASVPRSVAVFSNAETGFIWGQNIQVHVTDQVFWEEEPYLLPLIHIIGAHERYAVILADRVRARLFIIHMNEIEEIRLAENPDHKDVQRTQTSGMDHLRSQMQHQRLADTHALWHFKNVVEELTRSGERRPVFDRLVLSGPRPSVAELESLLPKAVKEKIAGTCSLSIHAKPSEVLDGVKELRAGIEQGEAKGVVEDLITMARKQDKAVLGMDAVFEASSRGQISRLVYTPGIEKKISAICQKVLTAGGRIEQVDGMAAEILDREGSIGAFLRFKA